MRFPFIITSVIVLLGINSACNNSTTTARESNLTLDSLSASDIDSFSIANSSRDIDIIPDTINNSRDLTKGSLWDEWRSYFKFCLQSDIDSKVSYMSMANTDGPGILYDEKLGLASKNIRNIIPAEVYAGLVEKSGASPTCTLNENEYKLIGGFFKATLFKLLNINPDAQGTKVDTVVFNMDHYSRLALNKGVLDSLYEASADNPALKKYFDEFSKKNVRLIIKGYLISGFNATIKFKKSDAANLALGLDTGLVKNISGSLGFKFNKTRENNIVAKSTNDFIPLVQFVKRKEIQ